MRRALLIGIVLACALPAPAMGLVTGVGDAQSSVFEDADFRSLRVDYVRAVVPFDTAVVADPEATAWLDRAHALGYDVMVAFEHRRGEDCRRFCSTPTVAEYEAALAAFRARFPWVTTWTAWNEPNHISQPTFSRPGLAAAYYNAAATVCPGCTMVAGDFLDSSTLLAYATPYRDALATGPAVWGLHNYGDATRFASRGLDELAQIVDGEIWLTETGGIVSYGSIEPDEVRAADSLRWLYNLLAHRERVTRMYVYQWRARATDAFDAGLKRPDGTTRPGLAIVRDHVGTRPVPEATEPSDEPVPAGAGAPAAEGTTPAGAAPVVVTRVRFSRGGARALRRSARVRVACVDTAGAACTGRATRCGAASGSAFRVARGAARAVRVPVRRRALARALQGDRRLCFSLAPQDGAAVRERLRLRRPRPRGRAPRPR